MVLFTGRTVEEAIEKGLNEMQLTRLKAHIKVVSREKHGFLGFGKKPAQVDIEGINEVTAHRADQKAVRGVPDTINQQNTPVSSQLEDTLELRKISGIIKQMEERGEKIDDEVKENIVKHKKSTQRILEEAGHTAVLEALEKADTPENTADTQEVSASPEITVSEPTPETPKEEPVSSTDNRAELSNDIEKAAEEVAAYVEKIIYEMDIEATLETSHNRRQINLQIETPEIGRASCRERV